MVFCCRQVHTRPILDLCRGNFRDWLPMLRGFRVISLICTAAQIQAAGVLLRLPTTDMIVKADPTQHKQSIQGNRRHIAPRSQLISCLLLFSCLPPFNLEVDLCQTWVGFRLTWTFRGSRRKLLSSQIASNACLKPVSLKYYYSYYTNVATL